MGSKASDSDPYAVLGLPKDCTDAEIRAKYKELARTMHPDKCPDVPDAQARFQRLQESYRILIDPDRRRMYDLGGMRFLQAHDAPKDIDPSQLSGFQRFVMGGLAKIGLAPGVRTAVPVEVVQAGEEGRFHASPLTFGESRQGILAEKHSAHFFTIDVTASDLESGIALLAKSDVGSQICMLVFEPREGGDEGGAPASSWRLVAEEHAWRVGRTSLCTVLSLPFPTYSLGPGPDADETRRCPESALFGRLRSLHPRERISLRPGRLAVAVVDTNWVLRSKYELVAVRQRDAVTACQGLQTAEAMVVAKKEELGQLESEFRDARARLESVLMRMDAEHRLMGEVLARRGDAYLKLAGGSQNADATNGLRPATEGGRGAGLGVSRLPPGAGVGTCLGSRGWGGGSRGLGGLSRRTGDWGVIGGVGGCLWGGEMGDDGRGCGCRLVGWVVVGAGGVEGKGVVGLLHWSALGAWGSVASGASLAIASVARIMSWRG